MKSKLIPILFTVVFALVSPLQVSADPMLSIQGKYLPVEPAQPTLVEDKVEVVEMFWYGCPHCYTFEPYITKWKETKPDHVHFERVPAVFRENWLPHARAFYASEEMGVFDQVHRAIFVALHEKKQKVFNREQLADLVETLGIDRNKFLGYYDSFSVENKVRKAVRRTRGYGIRGVPAVIVNGKYQTSGSIAGSFDNMIKVIDILVAEEHK